MIRKFEHRGWFQHKKSNGKEVLLINLIPHCFNQTFKMDVSNTISRGIPNNPRHPNGKNYKIA